LPGSIRERPAADRSREMEVNRDSDLRGVDRGTIGIDHSDELIDSRLLLVDHCLRAASGRLNTNSPKMVGWPEMRPARGLLWRHRWDPCRNFPSRSRGCWAPKPSSNPPNDGDVWLRRYLLLNQRGRGWTVRERKAGA